MFDFGKTPAFWGLLAVVIAMLILSTALANPIALPGDPSHNHADQIVYKNAPAVGFQEISTLVKRSGSSRPERDDLSTTMMARVLATISKSTLLSRVKHPANTRLNSRRSAQGDVWEDLSDVDPDESYQWVKNQLPNAKDGLTMAFKTWFSFDRFDELYAYVFGKEGWEHANHGHMLDEAKEWQKNYKNQARDCVEDGSAEGENNWEWNTEHHDCRQGDSIKRTYDRDGGGTDW